MSINISYFAGAGAQFFDDNGDPLAGGKLFVYAAGTTSYVTTYTDISGTTNNTNPIILDAAGRTPNQIWVVGGALYKFILQTSASVNVGTYDNIPAVDDPSTFNNFLSITGTNDIVANIVPAITAYIAGATYSFTVANTNTGAVTIDISGLGAKNILANGGAALVAGQLIANSIVSIEYDGVNSFQLMTASGAPNNVVSVNGGQLAGLRNRIINGGMQVAQRSLPAASSTLQFGVDRWQGVVSAGTGISGSFVQSTSASWSSGYYFGFGSCSWTAGTVQFIQLIEANNVQDLNGKTVTVSARVFQDTGGARTFAIQLYKPNAKDNWSSKTLIASVNTVSISSGVATAVKATITLGATDAVNGLAVYIVETASNTVVSKNYFIGDVQLEVGSVATTFEQRPYGMELALCQRYAYSVPIGAIYARYGATAATQYYSAIHSFPVTMRVAPTVTTAPGFSYTNAAAAQTQTISVNSISYAANSSAAGDSYFSNSSAALLTAEL